MEGRPDGAAFRVPAGTLAPVVRIGAWVLLAVVLAVLLAVKLPLLDLPFYWDEAWVYGPAVRTLAREGPSLLPGALPPELGRGHPLLFHATLGMAGLLFGDTPVVLHAAALGLSLVLLITLFLVVRAEAGPGAAVLAVTALAFQPVFLAQSGLVLPEVMLSLFTVLAVAACRSGRHGPLAVALTGAVLTKESGLAVAAAVVLYMGYEAWKRGRWPSRSALMAWVAPFAAFSEHALLQWEAHGWFLYPEHVGHTVTDPAAVLANLTEGFGAFLLVYQGRNALVILALLGVVALRWRGLSIPHGTTQGLLWTVIAALLCFSALNFYSARYILAAVVLLCWSLGLVLAPFLQGNLRTLAAMAVVALVTFVANGPRSTADSDLGYAEGARAIRDLAQHLSRPDDPGGTVAAPYIVREALTEPLAGYVERPLPADRLAVEAADADRIVRMDFASYGEELTVLRDALLEARFDHGPAHVALYRTTAR